MTSNEAKGLLLPMSYGEARSIAQGVAAQVQLAIDGNADKLNVTQAQAAVDAITGADGEDSLPWYDHSVSLVNRIYGYDPFPDDGGMSANELENLRAHLIRALDWVMALPKDPIAPDTTISGNVKKFIDDTENKAKDLALGAGLIIVVVAGIVLIVWSQK